MNHLKMRWFVLSGGGIHALEGKASLCKACATSFGYLLWHSDTYEILHTEKFLIFLHSAEKWKTILQPKCTIFLSVTLFIPAQNMVTFMLKFCLQRSKAWSSWVELQTFCQLFKLAMKEMCETINRLGNRKASQEKKDIKIQIQITFKQITFWWALEEITSNGFTCMHVIFSKFTTLLSSVGMKLNNCLLSVKSELHLNIGCTVKLFRKVGK